MSKYTVFVAMVLGTGALVSCGSSSEQPMDHSKSVKCDRWEEVLTTDEWHRKVYLVQEGCSGLANSLTVAIDLELPDGKRSSVFIFSDGSWDLRYANQTSPTVTWVDKNKLAISIGAVGFIYKKVDKVSDVDIAYQIGHVISEEHPQGSQN